MYDTCESRSIRPVIALKETQSVKDGKHLSPDYVITASVSFASAEGEFKTGSSTCAGCRES